jgi:hypothetical protein
LSKVTGAFSTSIVTKASTPLLDSNGNPTGSQLAGAVTVALSDEQARLAAQNQGLWSQGGVVDDPVAVRRSRSTTFKLPPPWSGANWTTVSFSSAWIA